MNSKRRKISHITSSSDAAEGTIYHMTSNSETAERGIQFLDLPPLILYKILGYLPQEELVKNVSKVCKSLREMSNDPVLWRTLKLECDTYYTLDYDNLKGLRKNLMRMPLLQNLRIKCLDWKPNKYFAIVRKLCPKITSIIVHMLGDIEALKNISQNFPNIESLHIWHCNQIETHKAAQIVSSFKRLRRLELSLDKCDQCGYNCMMEQVQNLEWFQSTVGLSKREILALVKNNSSTLKKLILDGCLEDCSYMKLAECKQLQEIGFNRVDLMTDRGLAALSNLPKLRTLKMGFAKLITPRGLQRFFESVNLRNLEDLCLINFPLDDNVVKVISNNCKYLRFLQFTQTEESVTDEGVQDIVNNLRYLEILSFGAMGNITGRCFDKIPEKLPDLKFLLLSKCKSIDKHVTENLKSSYSRLNVLYW